MENIIINKEGFATRCEICHQQDMFNPSTNFCQRCNSIKPTAKAKKKKIYSSRFAFNPIKLELATTKLLQTIQQQPQQEVQIIQARLHHQPIEPIQPQHPQHIQRIQHGLCPKVERVEKQASLIYGTLSALFLLLSIDYKGAFWQGDIFVKLFIIAMIAANFTFINHFRQKNPSAKQYFLRIVGGLCFAIGVVYLLGLVG